MALDLEEQEQVAELKAWWTQHGNRVLAVVIAVAVAVVGWQGWRWYEHSPAEDFRDLARLRLAAVLVDEKAYDEALKLLDAPHAPAYDAQYAALKGDVLVAKNQLAEARAAYQAALEKAERRDSPFRESVRMRLEALGG